jgi:hypothetical protein
LKKKETRGNDKHPSSNTQGNCDRENFDSQDKGFAATSKTGKLTDDIGIYDSGACGHTCISDKGLFDVKEINESIEMVT